METQSTEQNVTMKYVLIGALVAALVVGGGIAFVMTRSTVEEPVAEVTDVPSEDDSSESSEFNTSVLESTEYKQLDASLFARNLLPVQPPTGTGKANVFR